VKNHPYSGITSHHHWPIQPPNVLAARIAEARAAVSLADCIAEPSAMAPPLIVPMDDPPLRAASPLPYTEPSAPAGDAPMVESMEAIYINYTPPPEEVEM
jgi:hypothetical protein